MDAATVGSNSIWPSRNMLEVAPQSLTPRTGKSTLSKSMGLPLYHWSSSGRILSSHSQPRPEQKSWNNTDPWPPRVELGFFTCFSLCFLAKKPVKAASWSRKHFAKAPAVKMCEKTKNMQSWDFNCFFSDGREIVVESSIQNNPNQLPKGFRFLCSQRGRESSSLCSNEVLSCCCILFYLIRWYLDVSLWLMSGWSQQGMQGRKGMEGLRMCTWSWSNLKGVIRMQSHQVIDCLAVHFRFSGRMVSPVLPRHEHSRTLQQPVPLQCCIHRQATAAPGMGAQVASLDEPIWVTS